MYISYIYCFINKIGHLVIEVKNKKHSHHRSKGAVDESYSIYIWNFFYFALNSFILKYIIVYFKYDLIYIKYLHDTPYLLNLDVPYI